MIGYEKAWESLKQWLRKEQSVGFNTLPYLWTEEQMKEIIKEQEKAKGEKK